MTEQGETLWFSAALTDRPADQPGAVGVNAFQATLTITLPDGSVATPNVLNPPAVPGQYGVLFATTLPGRYIGRWFFLMATGLTAARTEVFEVSATDAGGLISVADAKKHLNIPITDTSSDDEIRGWINAITPVVENRVGVCVPRTITNERHHGGTYVLNLMYAPVLSVLAVGPWLAVGQTYGASQWVLDSEYGTVELASGLAWYPGQLRVSYIAGRSVIPENVQAAVKIILAHLWETQRGAAQPAYLGGADTTIVPGTSFAVPNRALELLEPDEKGPGVG